MLSYQSGFENSKSFAFWSRFSSPAQNFCKQKFLGCRKSLFSLRVWRVFIFSVYLFFFQELNWTFFPRTEFDLEKMLTQRNAKNGLVTPTTEMGPLDLTVGNVIKCWQSKMQKWSCNPNYYTTKNSFEEELFLEKINSDFLGKKDFTRFHTVSMRVWMHSCCYDAADQWKSR